MLELSKIITREQLCEQLGISANTLRRWTKERDFWPSEFVQPNELELVQANDCPF